MPGPFVRFDAGPLPGGTLFDAPLRLIRADTAQEVPLAFAAMERAVADGHWLAGYATYELGYLLDAALHGLLPEERALPLMLFGVFEGPRPAPPLPAPKAALAPGQPDRPLPHAPKRKATVPNTPGPDAGLSAPEPLWSEKRYARAFDTVHDYIGAGDIYQANLTFPLSLRYSGTPLALLSRLSARQPVPHGALVDLGGPVILSRSPELFFALNADGTLTTRPMKGTAPRGSDPASDDALRDALHVSDKNRAENLMIVDLLRNDMARVSRVGSVRVPELFKVERYATLHQMTSRVISRLRDGIGIADLFAALFPCGSITGAPKIRAMEIIRSLEEQPRGAYCGAIGWIAPSRAMSFNVAIRTLTLHPDGRAELSVGGGVVHDSTAADEYAEALLKADFARLSSTDPD